MSHSTSTERRPSSTFSRPSASSHHRRRPAGPCGWWASGHPNINPKGMSLESEWTIPLDALFLSRSPSVSHANGGPSSHDEGGVYFFSVKADPAGGAGLSYPVAQPSESPTLSSPASDACIKCGFEMVASSTFSNRSDTHSPQRAFGVSLVESTGERRELPAETSVSSLEPAVHGGSADRNPKGPKPGRFASLFSCCSSTPNVKEPRGGYYRNSKALAAPSPPINAATSLNGGEPTNDRPFPQTDVEHLFAKGFLKCLEATQDQEHNQSSSYASARHRSALYVPLCGVVPPVLVHNAVVQGNIASAMADADAWESSVDRATIKLLGSPNVSPPGQYWSRQNFDALRGMDGHNPLLSQAFSLGGGRVHDHRSNSHFNDSLEMQCVVGRSRLLPPLETVHLYLASLSQHSKSLLPDTLRTANKGKPLDDPPPREPIGFLKALTPDATPCDHALNLLSLLEMAYNSVLLAGQVPPKHYASPMTVRREMLSVLLNVVKAPHTLPPLDEDDPSATILNHAEAFYTAMFGAFDTQSTPPPPVSPPSMSHAPVPPSSSMWERQCCYCIELLGGVPVAGGSNRRRVAEAFLNDHKPTLGFLNFMPLSEVLAHHVVAVPHPSNPNVHVLCIRLRVSVFIAFSDALQGALYRLCATRCLPRYGLRGIKNHGATCYLNVVLQVFYHSRFLRRDAEGSHDVWEALLDLHKRETEGRGSTAAEGTSLPKGAARALLVVFDELGGGQESSRDSVSSVVTTKTLLRILGISSSVQFDAHEALSEFFLNGFFREAAESLFAWPVENVTQGLSDPEVVSHHRDILYEFALCVQGAPTLEDAFKKEFRGVEPEEVRKYSHLWTYGGNNPSQSIKEKRLATLQRWGFGEEDVLEYEAHPGKRVPALRFVQLPLSGGTREGSVVVRSPFSPPPDVAHAHHLPPSYSPSCSPDQRQNQHRVDISDIQLSMESPPRTARDTDSATPQRPPLPMMQAASMSLRLQREQNPPMIIVHTKRFDMYARKVHATQRYPLVLSWRFLLSLATDCGGRTDSSNHHPTSNDFHHSKQLHSDPEDAQAPQQDPSQRFAPTESVKRARKHASNSDRLNVTGDFGKAGTRGQFSFNLNSTVRGGLSSSAREGAGIDDDQDYVLYAVVAHHGTSVESGHYTCYLRFATDDDRSHPTPSEEDAGGHNVMFYHFDDEAVYPVPATSMLRDISGAHWGCPGTSAYLLFYVRRAEWLVM